MNTQSSGEAVQIANTYVEAIARKDVDTVISISADDIVCTSPRGRIVGTSTFREFHGGFARMLQKVTLLATYGDDQQAVVVYNADTHPVANAIVAELLKVRDGKIVSTEVIYDAAPFAAYAATVQPR
ncbi:nuclear transport factor 2 family protein [Bradyrhizobium huanghuaihaiense]|uniref:nuclear transport factor 2 family protein n=1 Tax=Bradyrhizobium huanghuaihaiense TaxID=990078 RepID=UPI0021AAE9E0|nr:nuclear transport factor 2 family protein [Bradyrhizobium sp. CB3035]UWU77562.1 nuclear transport factor 2 family protein [Bradyrhizobium sp. CB3035]